MIDAPMMRRYDSAPAAATIFDVARRAMSGAPPLLRLYGAFEIEVGKTCCYVTQV